MVQINRYESDDNWVPRKLECKVPVPRDIDLTSFRDKNEQIEGEMSPNELRADSNIDPEMLSELLSMGFSQELCVSALNACQNTDIESAVAWILNKRENNSVDKQSNLPGSETLNAMGFSYHDANLALRKFDNNLERAADWLFSRPSDLDQDKEEMSARSKPVLSSTNPDLKKQIREFNDTSTGKYSLKAFISHIGNSTHSGHYVCHINQNSDLSDPGHDQWVIFNDRKVALSKNPPFEHAYLAFYENKS